MLADLARAAALLDDRRVRRTLLISLGASAVLIVALFPTVSWLIPLLGSTGYLWVDQLAGILGLVGAAVIAWFMFPVLLIAVMGFFLDAVVEAAERRHFPHLPPMRPAPFAEIAAASARFAVLAIGLNLLCLPLYLVPPFNVAVFLVLNGWLFGREYFELVALRRMRIADATRLRQQHQRLVWGAGLVVAALATVPIVNLVAPLVGSAFVTLRLHRRGVLAPM